jgi:hypothetical protein
VIERITRIAADQFDYVFTIDDPANYSLRFILQAGRAHDHET